QRRHPSAQQRRHQPRHKRSNQIVHAQMFRHHRAQNSHHHQQRKLRPRRIRHHILSQKQKQKRRQQNQRNQNPRRDRKPCHGPRLRDHKQKQQRRHLTRNRVQRYLALLRRRQPRTRQRIQDEPGRRGQQSQRQQNRGLPSQVRIPLRQPPKPAQKQNSQRKVKTQAPPLFPNLRKIHLHPREQKQRRNTKRRHHPADLIPHQVLDIDRRHNPEDEARQLRRNVKPLQRPRHHQQPKRQREIQNGDPRDMHPKPPAAQRAQPASVSRLSLPYEEQRVSLRKIRNHTRSNKAPNLDREPHRLMASARKPRTSESRSAITHQPTNGCPI